MKGIIKQILLATCVIGAPTCVFAFPFQPNPQSFQSYMNTVRWEDGSKTTFQNIGGCEFYPASNSRYSDTAVCRAGFVTISNPMGTKICNLTIARYIKGIYDTSGKYANFTYGNCRYK